MNEVIPSEDDEQVAFVQWMDLQHIPYFHVNNEMWTKSWKQKARSKAMGTKSGIPDLFVVFNEGIVGFEMKRKRNGTVSPTQKYWGRLLSLVGVPVYCCRGCDSAISTYTYLIKNGYTKCSEKKIQEAELLPPYLKWLTKKLLKLLKIVKNLQKSGKMICPIRGIIKVWKRKRTNLRLQSRKLR